MWRACLSALVALGVLVDPSLAGERQKLGYGVLFSNDQIGDGEDRWRTGSVTSSRIWGPEWTGSLPQGFGDLIELRIGGQIIAPESITRPRPGDRRYAGALGVGLHTHLEAAGYQLSMGADLVGTGPALGLDDLQDLIHDILNGPRVSGAVSANQIPDGLHVRAVAEVGRDFSLGARSQLRPFLEVHAGVETLARAGFDLTIGEAGRGELLVREDVTGQRYRVVRQDWNGTSFVFGGDITQVGDTIFLPSGGAAVAEDTRTRLRTGLHWQGENDAMFFLRADMAERGIRRAG